MQKKISKFLLFLFITTFSFVVNAQSPTINWGKDIKSKSFNKIIETIKIGDNFYVYTEYKEKPEIHTINAKSLELTQSSPITFPKEKKTVYDVYAIVNFGEKLHILYTQYKKEDDITTLFATELNVDGSFSTDKAKELASEVSNSKRNQADFSLSYSPDKKIVAIQGIPTGKRKDNLKLSFQVFNTNGLTKKDEIANELPYQNKEVAFYNFQVDNLGNVHSLIKVAADRKEYPSGYLIKILTYYANGKSIKEQEIDLQGNYITEAFITVDEQNNLKLAGYYSEKRSYSMKGYFFYKFDVVNKKVKKSIFNKFDQNLTAQIIGEKRAKKGKELPIFTIREVYEQEDGGIYILSEYFSYSVYTSKNATTQIWSYNHVMVIDVDANGKTSWVSVIPKAQTFSRTTPSFGVGGALGGGLSVGFAFNLGTFRSYEALKYYGFSSFVKGNQMYVLYNGSHKDKPEKGEEGLKRMKNYKKSVLKTVTINTITGEKEYSHETQEKYIYIPGLSYQYDEHKALIFSEKSDMFKLGIIEL